MSTACRICLQEDDADGNGRLFYPCRCKAPVHQECLDAWRTSGINPANLTRCEVCQYHYHIGKGAPVRTCTVHLIFYCVAVLFYGILFFGLAFGFGELIRFTEILDLLDGQGQFASFKPESTGGFLLLGVCINFFLIGVGSSIYLFFLWMTGRLRSRRLVAARQIGSWTTVARQQRRRQADCCTDCCYSCNNKCCDPTLGCYFCLLGNPCDVCCARCDDGSCCECAGCMDCKDCSNCGGGDCPLLFMGFLLFLAFCLVVLGAFVLLCFVMANVMYGMFLHQRYVKQQIARKWPVQDYDSALDERHDIENPTQPAKPAEEHNEPNETKETTSL
eukprot:Skav223637  [mRNA]  locus=scaffold46:254060:255055:+ [translate_table: standard]